MTPENKATPGTNHCGYCGRDMLRGSDCRSSDDARVCGMYNRFTATHAVAGNNSQVTGEAAPAEGVKLTETERLTLFYREQDKHPGMDMVSFLRGIEAAEAHFAAYTSMGAQRGSAGAIKDHQIAAVVSNVTAVAREFHATQQLRERVRDAMNPLIEAVRGSAGDAGAPFAKGSWQHAVDDHLVGYGKTSEEFASSHDAVAWLLAQVSDAACLNKGDSAASPTPDAPTDQAATVSPPPSAPRPS